MSDPANQQSRWFVKGVKRAAFSSPPPPPPTPVVAKEEQQFVSPEVPVVLPTAPAVSAPAVQHVKKNNTTPLAIVLIILMFGSIATVWGGAFFLYQRSQATLKKLEQATAIVSKEEINEKDSKTLVEKVAAHMVLPDETPQVRPVKDVETLRTEPFYAKAQNGDVVLVYSKRAILYSLIQDKIIEVGVVRQAESGPTPTAVPKEAAVQPTPQVAGASTSAKILYEGE